MISARLRKIGAASLAFGLLGLMGSTSATAQTATITFTVPNCTSFTLTGSPPNQTLTCNNSGGGGGTAAPTNCGVSANPGSLTGANAVSLAVSCGGGAPTSYQWSASPGVTFTNGSTTGGNTNSALISQTTAFTVVASNSGGSSTATTSVQVNSGGGGGGGGAVSCDSRGYSKTMFYNWDWNSGGFQTYTDVDRGLNHNPLGPIGPNGIVVIAFTAQPAGFAQTGSVTIAPFPGDLSSTTRSISISTTPCDFSQPFPWTRVGLDAGIQFTVGTFVPDLYPPLVAGRQYYINITSRDQGGGSSCSTSGRACDMVIQAFHP